MSENECETWWEYWSMFADNGLFVPVRDCECIIDTGGAQHISVSAINYGLQFCQSWGRLTRSLMMVGSSRLLCHPNLTKSTSLASVTLSRDSINYIPLNAATRLSGDSVSIIFHWMLWQESLRLPFLVAKIQWKSLSGMDFPSVFDALTGCLCWPQCKWTYKVVPFGLVIGLEMFITFIHGMNPTWNVLIKSKGVSTGDNTNERIIVDNILVWASELDTTLLYMKCQLQIHCPKTCPCIFPNRMEVVGIDVSQNGTQHTMSKHQLLWTWPAPLTVRDIVSLIGFAISYSTMIPHCEVCAKRIHKITKLAYSGPVAPHFDRAARLSGRVLSAMLSDQCMIRFDHRKCLYLRMTSLLSSLAMPPLNLLMTRSLSWQFVVKWRELRSNSLA